MTIRSAIRLLNIIVVTMMVLIRSFRRLFRLKKKHRLTDKVLVIESYWLLKTISIIHSPCTKVIHRYPFRMEFALHNFVSSGFTSRDNLFSTKESLFLFNFFSGEFVCVLCVYLPDCILAHDVYECHHVYSGDFCIKTMYS